MTADPHGLDVIDHATALIAAAYTRGVNVRIDRATNPDAHPEYGPDLNPRAIARRAVGDLLAAGMLVTPLTPEELADLRRTGGQG